MVGARKRFTIGVDDRVAPPQAALLGVQHFLSMFGGTVLVPYLTGMSASLAIMCSGVGTILYLLVTRGKIPSYLGSSFAYITPIAIVAASGGIGAACGGIVAAGIVYMGVAGLVKLVGTGWIDRFLPTVVVAPVVIVIGLGLASDAVEMSFFNGGYDSGGGFVASGAVVAFISLAVIVATSCLPGIWAAFPVLIGIVVGYIAAVCFGLVDFAPVIEAPWVGLPSLVFPTFELSAMVLIAPVALVAIVEHIGHLLVVGQVVGKNYNGMLSRSLLGDGLATTVAGLVGGAPATTYAQNIGVMSVTRVYSTQVFWYAGAFALIVGGFCPKLEALVNSVPSCVMGGVSLVLFGLIATNGMSMLTPDKVDFSDSRDLMIVASVLVLGIGMECAGIVIPLGDYSIPGMAACAILGVVLNLALPRSQESSPQEPTE